MTKSHDERFAQWNGWLGTIQRDVSDLLFARFVFKGIFEIVRSNPKIHTDSLVYDWMAEAWAAQGVLGVRRQLDRDTRSASLQRLLTEIASHPEVIS